MNTGEIKVTVSTKRSWRVIPFIYLCRPFSRWINKDKFIDFIWTHGYKVAIK